MGWRKRISSQGIDHSTGATAKRMHLPGEENLWQKGISACAVCDGALPYFRNKVLAVIGGGDSAVEEATYLTKFASKVLMIVRRDVLRASKVMQERAQNNPKIEILFNTLPLEVLGEKNVSGLKIKNAMTNAESTLSVGGLFYAIGHLPNTAFLEGQLGLDETGYIKTITGSTKTMCRGFLPPEMYRIKYTARPSLPPGPDAWQPWMPNNFYLLI